MNDANEMSALLQKLLEFQSTGITVPTDAQAAEANIMNNLNAMVDGAKAGKYSSLVFVETKEWATSSIWERVHNYAKRGQAFLVVCYEVLQHVATSQCANARSHSKPDVVVTEDGMVRYGRVRPSVKLPTKWVGAITSTFVVMAYALPAYAGEMITMKEVTVSESDHDRLIEVAPGSRIVVRLPENPSTGYRWELEPSEETVFKLEADTYQPPAVSVPGAGGIRIFEFHAQSAGMALIRLRLRRPWEREHAINTFEVTVRAQAGAS